MKHLQRLSLFTAFFGLVLVVAGGLVTSHQAGLSVPDWPLSYGQWMPPMIGKIFWEHGHRMIASFVGFLTLTMCIWTHWARSASKQLKGFSRILVELVILQGVLGGLTVLYNLPQAISIVHASLGQIFFSSLCLFAYSAKCEIVPTSFFISDEKKPLLSKAFRIARITAIIFLLQLFLGAATRHMKHMHVAWTHAAFALIVVMHVIFVFLRVSNLQLQDNAPLRVATFLLSAVMLQVLLGVGSLGLTQFMQRGPQPSTAQIWFTTFHQSLGAVLLASILLLTLMLHKRTQSLSAKAC